MRPTRRPVKMSDVAQKAGVSPMTVSRAFRNDGSVAEPTRAAVMAAAEELGYVFDSTAATLRLQRTGFVAVTIPSLNNANFAETLAGLTEGLRAQRLQLLLGNTDYDIAREEALIEELLRRRPEAIVVTGGNHTPRARKLLGAAGIPVVEMWDLPAEPVDHVVGFSNAAAIEALVAALVAGGRQRIAFIGGDDAADSRGVDRRRGFVAAMARAGLAATRLVDLGPPPVSMREGRAAMARLLAAAPDTDAVICVSDLPAFGALTECQARGIAVPGAIWIAGFGDYEIAGVALPALTTVNPFPREIGREVAALLQRALSDTGAEAERIVITPELIRRQSTG